nr:type II secretion system F family protein [uncultured Dysosmobacter sp.]
MVFLILIPATVLTVFWLALLFMVTPEDWVAAAYAQVVDNRLEAECLRQLDDERAAELAQYHGVMAKVMGLFLGGTSEKKIRKLDQHSQDLQDGYLGSLNIFGMPGYVLLRKVDAIGHGTVHKTILEKYTELYGRKYAPNKTKQLLAKLLSYAIIGVAASLTLGGIITAASDGMTGLFITLLGTVIVMVLVYAIYDEVSDRLNKRRAAITRQFPGVVSKLALLVTSGMIMDRAWRETAESQNGELYREMRLTAEELANLVEPTAAYTNFINRCSTKETTKLASAIIQNQSKGNAEIGALLRGMSHDAWQERRHNAKRDSEAANSKLMIPTMLLFVAILVMIMVPVALNFSNL